MKNDKLIYVLVPAVAIIWLIIGYRFYQAVKPEEDVTVREVSTIIPVVETRPIYQLQLNYPDPFLKKEHRSVSITIVKVHSLPKSSRPATTPAKPAATSWEGLTYHGMIENNQTTERVGIVTLDGVRKLVKEGEHIGAFTVERILKDSVRIQADEEVRYITKKGRIQWLSNKP